MEQATHRVELEISAPIDAETALGLGKQKRRIHPLGIVEARQRLNVVGALLAPEGVGVTDEEGLGPEHRQRFLDAAALVEQLVALVRNDDAGRTPGGQMRDDLIAEAKERIAKGEGKYVNHIYGIEEVGGTSVLLLSSVPFEAFGYKTDISTEALPLYTYRVLEKLPDVVLLAVVSLGGIWWLRNRKEEVAEAEGHALPNKA